MMLPKNTYELQKKVEVILSQQRQKHFANYAVINFPKY